MEQYVEYFKEDDWREIIRKESKHSKGKHSKDKSRTWINEMIGGRIRDKRREKGVTQYDLGYALGITFQQIQKYEKGINRVSVEALLKIAKELGERPEYFYKIEDEKEEQLVKSREIDIRSRK